MNQDLIKKHVEDFAQKLDLLVRQSVLETLKGVLGQASGAVAAPKRGRPAGSGRGPGRPRGRRPADLGDALAKMVDYVKANDGQGISAIAAGTGIDLKVAVIDASADPEGTWRQRREIGEDGAILVRQDVHVGWRSKDAASKPAEVLEAALRQVLSRP